MQKCYKKGIDIIGRHLYNKDKKRRSAEAKGDKTMTRSEFEKLAGYEVSAETYKNIIEPMYMNTDWDKMTFVKKIKSMREALEERHARPRIIVGVAHMPNGTLMTYEAELIEVNIKTGKMEVKRISNNRCWAETNCDVWATRVKELN